MALGQSPWTGIAVGGRVRQDPPDVVRPGGAVAVEECSAGSDATAWVEDRMIGQTARRRKDLSTGDDLCHDDIFGKDRAIGQDNEEHCPDILYEFKPSAEPNAALDRRGT
jgi:hypothetical protein